MAYASRFAVVTGIGMHHLHGFCIAAIQTIGNARFDQWSSWIKAYDTFNSEIKVIGHETAYVSAQRMSYTSGAMHWQSGMS